MAPPVQRSSCYRSGSCIHTSNRTVARSCVYALCNHAAALRGPGPFVASLPAASLCALQHFACRRKRWRRNRLPTHRGRPFPPSPVPLTARCRLLPPPAPSPPSTPPSAPGTCPPACARRPNAPCEPLFSAPQRLGERRALIKIALRCLPAAWLEAVRSLLSLLAGLLARVRPCLLALTGWLAGSLAGGQF